jgi:hypothetical protein
MTNFLGMEVDQTKGSIKLHLDTYIQDTIDEYKSVCAAERSLSWAE